MSIYAVRNPLFVIAVSVTLFNLSCLHSLLRADDEDVLESLETGWNSWLAEAEFKAEYTYSEMIVDTPGIAEDVLEITNPTLEVHGRIIKLDSNTLYSCYVDHDEYSPPQMQNFVRAISEELEFHYEQESFQGEHGGNLRRLFVSHRDPETAHLPYPSLATGPSFDPFTYSGGKSIPNSISLCKRLEEVVREGFSWRIESSDEGRVILHSVLDGEYEIASKSIIFNLEYSWPIVEEISETIDYKDSGIPSISRHIRASDFVNVGGGVPVPSRIRRISYPLRDSLGERFEGKCRVQLWRSDDIGKEQPSEQDFVLALNSGTYFGGLRASTLNDLRDPDTKELLNENTVLSISDFSIADLENQPEESVLGIDVSREGMFMRWIFIIVGPIGILVFFSWRIANRVRS